MKENKDTKPSLMERFRYWFDNRMSKGSLGLVKILLIATVLAVVVISLLILAFGLHEDGEPAGVFWDSMTTVINAWMPYYEDGGIGYLILMAVAALIGLLVTSVLIGIFASAIEEKITSLKNGNSAVLEKDHIVVLGYVPGEFTLIKQLIDASADNKRCIVVAGDTARDEMEDAIRDNVEVPKNVRLVCRNIDIFDPASLEKCCIRDAQAVIVNPSDDVNTVKTLLAVASILGDDPRVYTCSVVSRGRYLLPEAFAETHNITQLLANRLLSKVIAHSCTQPGLSETLMEFLDYDGSNLCEVTLPEAAGLPFSALVQRLSGGVPAGLFLNGRYVLNPPADEKAAPDGRLLVFTEDPGALKLEEAAELNVRTAVPAETGKRQEEILILGVNEEITTVLQELPGEKKHVRIAGADEEAKAQILECVGALNEAGQDGLAVEFVRDTVPKHKDSLEALIGDAAHIVLLSDHEADEDEADVDNVIRILSLRTIRQEKGLEYSITAELRRELSQRLADAGDSTDFIVASNMVALFLSQLADRPDLETVFRELLSNEGNEIYLKSAASLGCAGRLTVREARAAALSQGCLLLGYMKEEDGKTVPVFDPPLDEGLALADADRLIVLSAE
ncbi:MAG: hypothetical protein J6Z38_02165 [Lachnospiraceae bacterium]|nr:hypothetical protein [Lachnospiraceae bacterium]